MTGEVFRYISNALVIWAALVGIGSVYLHSRVPWWSSEMGRHLMAYMSVMAAALSLAVVRIIIGDSLTFQTIRLVVFVGVPIVMTQRLLLQWKAQRDSRRPVKPDA